MRSPTPCPLVLVQKQVFSSYYVEAAHVKVTLFTSTAWIMKPTLHITEGLTIWSPPRHQPQTSDASNAPGCPCYRSSLCLFQSFYGHIDSLQDRYACCRPLLLDTDTGVSTVGNALYDMMHSIMASTFYTLQVPVMILNAR